MDGKIDAIQYYIGSIIGIVTGIIGNLMVTSAYRVIDGTNQPPELIFAFALPIFLIAAPFLLIKLYLEKSRRK